MKKMLFIFAGVIVAYGCVDAQKRGVASNADWEWTKEHEAGALQINLLKPLRIDSRRGKKLVSCFFDGKKWQIEIRAANYVKKSSIVSDIFEVTGPLTIQKNSEELRGKSEYGYRSYARQYVYVSYLTYREYDYDREEFSSCVTNFTTPKGNIVEFVHAVADGKDCSMDPKSFIWCLQHGEIDGVSSSSFFAVPEERTLEIKYVPEPDKNEVDL